MSAVCRSCQHPVIWALTEKGRRAPFNVERVTAGTRFEITPGEGIGTAVRVLADLAPGHVSHSATCPKANEHRRPR